MMNCIMIAIVANFLWECKWEFMCVISSYAKFTNLSHKWLEEIKTVLNREMNFYLSIFFASYVHRCTLRRIRWTFFNNIRKSFFHSFSSLWFEANWNVDVSFNQLAMWDFFYNFNFIFVSMNKLHIFLALIDTESFITF